MSAQADMEEERQLLQVIKYMLSKRDENSNEYLSVLGNQLRVMGYTLPKGGLKRFCLRYTKEFDFHESSADSTSSDRQSNRIQEQDGSLHTMSSLHEMHERVDMLPRYCPEKSKILEKRIVAYILDYMQRRGETISMPILGEFCIHSLDVDMKGHLLNFLRGRPHLFTISDLDRQIVSLTENAAHIVGLGSDPYLPDLPQSIQDFYGHRKNSNEATSRDDQGTMVCNKMSYYDALLHPKCSRKENAIAAELYRILINQDGIGRFEDIEAKLKNVAPEQILSTGAESVEKWHLGSLLYNYPHVFHRLGDLVALVERIKPDFKRGTVFKRGNLSGDAHTSLNEEEFPDLA
eukprot:jgi/Picsp_1/3271/NSC_06111-R1_hypothetical protein CHLNCDRAFT_57342 [Chlorella variabilis]